MQAKDAAPTLEVTSPAQWREWLERHTEGVTEVWLTFWKAHTGKKTLSYDAAVEEALCFGWVDSLVKKLDEDRYRQKFSPRKDWSRWSPSNLKRMKALIESARMTPAGLQGFDLSLLKAPPAPPEEIPDSVLAGLRSHAAAWEAFQCLAPSHQRNYLRWISAAKREDTRQRRIAEAVRRLEEGQPLGLK